VRERESVRVCASSSFFLKERTEPSEFDEEFGAHLDSRACLQHCRGEERGQRFNTSHGLR